MPVSIELDVLIVEDEKVARRALASLLTSCGIATCAVGSAEEALENVSRGKCPSVALVDVDLPGMSGLELVSQLERSHPALRAVLITAAEGERIRNFCNYHPVDYMPKPIDFGKLLALLGERAGTQ